MVYILDLIKDSLNVSPIIKTIISALVLFIIFVFLVSIIKRILLKKVRAKKQISNVQIFSRVLIYTFLIFLVVFAVSSIENSWAGLGLGLGLFSAALGWALQKPITGMAAWIMIVIKRPFDIGDRIIIGPVRGDVIDISLTHIYLMEIGGIVAGEENSGRIVMVPNSILFEQNIVNYNSKDDYVLDQVSVTITYESDLKEAKKIILESAKEELNEIIIETKKEPYIRNYFQDSGIEVKVRYFAPSKRLQEYSSNVTERIFENVKNSKSVEIAYPHTEILYRKKE